MYLRKNAKFRKVVELPQLAISAIPIGEENSGKVAETLKKLQRKR